MSILNNLLGANVDPMQQQLATLLGVEIDPKTMQRKSRQRGLASIGQALMQAGGGAGGTLAALGQGLQNAQGSGNDLLTQEMQRALQFRQLQEQQTALKQRAAMQEQMKTLLPNALKGMDPDQAQLVALMIGSGDPALQQQGFKMVTEKPKGPSNEWELRLAAANGDLSAQKAIADREAAALQRAERGRAPDIAGPIAKIIESMTEKAADKSGGAAGTQFAGINEAARQASQYAQSIGVYNDLLGEQQPIAPFMNTVGQLARSTPLRGGVEKYVYGSADQADRVAEAARMENDLTLDKSGLLKGATSDRDIGFLKDSGPSLLRTPEGRRMMQKIAEAKANQMNQAAALVNQLQEQGVPPTEIQTRLNQFINDNPITTQFWGAAGYTPKGGQPAAGGAPATQAPASAGGGWKVEVIGG